MRPMRLVVQKKESYLQEQERQLSELKGCMIPIVRKEIKKIKKGKMTTARLRKIKSTINWWQRRIDKIKKDEDRKLNSLEIFLLKQGIKIDYV